MMQNNSKKLAEILLVDDSEADILFTKVRLKKENIMVNLSIVRDGNEAIDFLKCKSSGGRPDLVIMDLCMPQMGGLETLSVIRNDNELYDIPVVICSGSDDAEDIRRSMRLGAIDYIVKPLDYYKLEEVIDKVKHLRIEEETGNKVIYSHVRELDEVA